MQARYMIKYHLNNFRNVKKVKDYRKDKSVPKDA